MGFLGAAAATAEASIVSAEKGREKEREKGRGRPAVLSPPQTCGAAAATAARRSPATVRAFGTCFASDSLCGYELAGGLQEKEHLRWLRMFAAGR